MPNNKKGRPKAAQKIHYSRYFTLLNGCTCRQDQPCRICQTWRRLAFGVWARRAGI